MNLDETNIQRYVPYNGNNVLINNMSEQDLRMSDAVQKRLWKNNILINPNLGIDNLFQSILNSINIPDCDIRYLIKGTHAWENLFRGVNDVELKPQNYDLEIYVLTKYKSPCTKKVIFNLFNELINARNHLRSKGLETCLYLSNNIDVAIRSKTKIRCDKDQPDTPLEKYNQVMLKKPEDQEVFKGWLLSLCFQDNSFPNYNDDSYCGHNNNFSHQIFNISVFQIKEQTVEELSRKTETKFYLQNLTSEKYVAYVPQKGSNVEYFKTYLDTITSTNTRDGRVYLNQYGLLMYDSFIKRVLLFRKEKGRNLEEYRLNLLKQVFLQTTGDSFVQAYYYCNILSNILAICPDLWMNDFFIGSLQSELIESMLINYTPSTLPNGIKQRIDDVIIGYFRPIMNSIILDLDFAMKQTFGGKVKVFIAGGDAFERYITTGKIADIDIKVIILRNSGTDIQAVLDAVRKIVVHLLSKHTVFLNYLIRQKDYLHFQSDEDLLFNEDLLKSAPTCPPAPINVDSKLSVNIPQGFNFKLCPNDEKSAFRVRSLNKVQRSSTGNLEGYNLISIDYRKKFWVYYKDPSKNLTSIPLYYKYDLAILDVPIIIFDESHWTDSFIDLQYSNIDNSPLNYQNRLIQQFPNTSQNMNTPPFEQPFFPVASKEFLIFDILERFNEESKNQLRERYLVGKIPKDISRFITLKRDISQNKTANTSYNVYSKVYLDLTYGLNFKNNLVTARFRDLRSDIIFYASNILRNLMTEKQKSKVQNDFTFEGVNNKSLSSIPDLDDINKILAYYTPQFIASFTCKLDDPENDFKLVNMRDVEELVGAPAKDLDEGDVVEIEEEQYTLLQELMRQTGIKNETIAFDILSIINFDQSKINDLFGMITQVSTATGLSLEDAFKALKVNNFDASRTQEYLIKELSEQTNNPPIQLVNHIISAMGGNLGKSKNILLQIDTLSKSLPGIDLVKVVNIFQESGWDINKTLTYFQSISR